MDLFQHQSVTSAQRVRGSHADPAAEQAFCSHGHSPHGCRSRCFSYRHVSPIGGGPIRDSSPRAYPFSSTGQDGPSANREDHLS